MYLPVDIQYIILDFAFGTPKQQYRKSMLQLRELNCQFVKNSYIDNVIDVMKHRARYDQIHWNHIWYICLYKLFFTNIAARRLRDHNIPIYHINKIFINFSKASSLGLTINPLF